MITDWLTKYWYLLLGLVMLLTGVIYLWRDARTERSNEEYSIFDYMFIWPMLIDQYKKKSTKGSNTFVIVGLCIMVILVAYGIISSPHGRLP